MPRESRPSRLLALFGLLAAAGLCAGCVERAEGVAGQRICTPSMTDFKTDIAQPGDTPYLPTPGE
jgi:hypothetical protein